MKKILFVYDHKYPDLWKDGLWAALKILHQYFHIDYLNLQTPEFSSVGERYDFILGWGAFGSPAQTWMVQEYPITRKGLCIGGMAPPGDLQHYFDVLFYETEWYRDQIKTHPRTVHAFGINTDIYWWDSNWSPKIWDFLSVGAFALWKRHHLLLNKKGIKMVVGEVQKENLEESLGITAHLVSNGVGVMDMVKPEILSKMYKMSKKVYIPADINGGGERAVLEARACGIDVGVEDDNPKLKELLNCELWNHHYYASQLKKGIEEVL